MKPSTRLHFLAAATLAVALLRSLAPAAVASPLEDILREKNLESFIATWGDKATNGGAVKVSYEWKLDRNAIAVKVESNDRRVEGMIFIDPKTHGISHLTVDTNGGTTAGVWTIEEDRVVLKFTYTDRNGETKKGAIAHEKVDADTMRVKMSKVGDSGEIEPNNQDGFELVRLKADPKK